jgi:hypothetical protein
MGCPLPRLLRERLKILENNEDDRRLQDMNWLQSKTGTSYVTVLLHGTYFCTPACIVCMFWFLGKSTFPLEKVIVAELIKKFFIIYMTAKTFHHNLSWVRYIQFTPCIMFLRPIFILSSDVHNLSSLRPCVTFCSLVCFCVVRSF